LFPGPCSFSEHGERSSQEESYDSDKLKQEHRELNLLVGEKLEYHGTCYQRCHLETR